MISYACKICSFDTHIKSHYERHCNTKKHLSNLKTIENGVAIGEVRLPPLAPMSPFELKREENV